MAAFGLTAVTTALVGISFWTRLVGGAFLIYLGVRTLLAKPGAGGEAADARRGLVAVYASTVVLTLTNPATIISFLGVFAGLGIGAGSGWSGALLIVAGVLRAINIGSGLLIAGFGLVALGSLVFGP